MSAVLTIFAHFAQLIAGSFALSNPRHHASLVIRRYLIYIPDAHATVEMPPFFSGDLNFSSSFVALFPHLRADLEKKEKEG